MQLLETFLPPQPTSPVAGRYSVELGLCYRDLGQPEKALEVLVSAAERVRSLRDNSEVEKYVQELGGVPLDEDRDVDVTYLTNCEGRKIFLGSLTTDGSRLLGAMNNRASNTGFVRAFDPDTKEWSTLADQLGQVSSLCVQGDSLWAGTKENGIWRGSLSGDDWKQWTAADGLPDDRVLTLTATEPALFASLGTTSAGGVVRIDEDASVTVLDGKNSPTAAPEHLVIQDNLLLTATRSAFHQLNLETGEWARITEVPGRGPISVFPGRTNAWTSRYRAELVPFSASDEEVESFSNGWFKPEPNEGASGFLIHFVIDLGDEVWYGGYPWARFRSVGLYRFNRKTREFRMFNLRDGFHMSVTYSMSSGVAIGDDLYVSTAAGLARVSPRYVSDAELQSTN